MMRAILALATALMLAGPARAEAIPVDLRLVLAVDCSGSVNADEFRLQMHGIAQAFRHPVVLQAIQRGARGAIAVALMQWSSQDSQHVAVPWTMVSDEESMETLADIIDNAPRFMINGSTAIGDALRFTLKMLEATGFESERKVVDVSGDGSSNAGQAPDDIRDELVLRGIQINGLAILTDEPNLREYYERSVIGGPGAFVIVADDYASFGNAVLSKLITEVAARPIPTQIAEVP